MAKQIVLMVGSLKDGYTFYGPFANHAHAKKFGEKHFTGVLNVEPVEMHGPEPLTVAMKKAA